MLKAPPPDDTSFHVPPYCTFSVSVLRKYLKFVLSLKRNTSALQRRGNSPGSLPENSPFLCTSLFTLWALQATSTLIIFTWTFLADEQNLLISGKAERPRVFTLWLQRREGMCAASVTPQVTLRRPHAK